MLSSLAKVIVIGYQRRGSPGTPATPWHTSQLVLRRHLGPCWALAVRGDYYYAQYGVVIPVLDPTPAQRDFFVRGASLNLYYAPSRHVLVRPEGKFLNSKNARFLSDASSPATNYGSLTSTVALSF